MEGGGGRVDTVEAATVVGGGITLAEVVGLNLGVITTEPLPINLIQISGLEDDRGDNTDTRGGLELDVETAEEDALVGSNGGGVGLLGDTEDGTVVAVGEGGSGERVDGGALARGEVAVSTVLSEGRLSRASYSTMVSFL